MRIIIDIEGDDVTIRTERGDASVAKPAAAEPPPEILRIAAKVGAQSAGPAPERAELDRMATTLSADEIEAIAGSASSAGAGPVPPPHVTQAAPEASAEERPPRRTRSGRTRRTAD